LELTRTTIVTSGQSLGVQSAGAREGLASVALQDHDGIPVAAIGGEVDISNVDEIAGAFTELPAAGNGLVVDLTATQYLDSSGIALLHDLASRLERRSQRLVIVAPSGTPTRMVLDLTAMNARALCCDELGPALDALSE
jgi:anti-anti-sigma factor